MKIKVRSFLALRELLGAEREIELSNGTSVGDVLKRLCDTPERRRKILDNSGRVRGYIRVLKNGRDIKYLNDESTELTDGDIVALFPPAGGG
jgi:molybdopterin synthase sulfur carrier subunit